MKPRGYMILGACSGAVALFVSLLLPDTSAAAMAFAGGALFGKGYGVWEERQRRRRALDGPTEPGEPQT